MNDFKVKTVICLLSVAAIAAGPSRTEARQYEARAYALETGALLYTEHHEEIWESEQLIGGRVEYRYPDGTVFARKELSFENGRVAPAFRMVDERNGFVEGASWEKAGLRLFSADGEEHQAQLIEEPPVDAVIDAGFHRFMQERLPDLIAGEEPEFSFAVPSYGRFLRFRVIPDGVNQLGQLELRMKPANPFLRLLVDPIELRYDRWGRLLEFRGVTNIPDENGERHLARIVFSYPEDIDEARLAAAG